MLRLFSDAFSDLRVTARSLLRRPAFSLSGVLTIAIGIGASVTVFGVTDWVALRPIPLPEPDRLVEVFGRNRIHGWDYTGLSVPNLQDLRSSVSGVRLAGFRSTGYTVADGDFPERVGGYQVSWDLFDVLGVSPARGRFFGPADESPGSERVAVISYPAWSTRYGLDPGILGRTLTLDGVSHAIVGVLPPDFWFRGQNRGVWVPLRIAGTEERGSDDLHVVGRLAGGASLEWAGGEIVEAVGRLAAAFPESNQGLEAGIRPFREHVIPRELKAGALICLAGVGVLLLIACVNVSNLLLFRVIDRKQELAIRGALGASPGRVARHLFAESLMMSAVGGGLGVVLAVWGCQAVRSLLPSWIPTIGEVGIEWRALAFAGSVTVLSAALVGLVPVFRTNRLGLAARLPQTRGSSQERSGMTVTRWFVGSQVLLATALLVVSCLLLRGFLNLRATDFGWDPEGLLTFRVDLPEQEYREDWQVREFYLRATSAIASLPGVASVGGTSLLPTRGDSHVSYELVGEGGDAQGELVARERVVLPGYFASLRIPVSSGRKIGQGDTDGDEAVAMVNEAFVRRHWPQGDAVGKLLRAGEREYRIIGVVPNTLDWERRPEPTLYSSAVQAPRAGMSLLVRSDGSGDGMAESIRTSLAGIDPDLPLFSISTMQDIMKSEQVAESSMAKLMSSLAAISVLLSLVGIYGVMASSVSSVRHDLGVRLALGATRGRVVGQVLLDGIRPTAAGLLLGLLLAFALARALSSFLYGVASWDPITYAGVAVTMLGAGVIAVLLPAREVARLDPVMALQPEV